MKKRILLASVIMLLAGSQFAFPQASSSFSAGLNDRAAVDNWFAQLTGPFRAGAEFWAAHRSASNEAVCKGRGSWLAGCQAAQQRLAMPDARRKTDPGYRTGWNTAVSDPQPIGDAAIQRPAPQHVAATEPSITTSHLGLGHWLLGAAVLAAMFVLGRAVMALFHRRSGLHAAMTEVKAQANRLHVRKIQLTQPDYYGTIDFAKWEREKQAFVKTRIMPILARGGFSDVSAGLIPRILREVESAASQAIAAQPPGKFSNPNVFDKSMNPIDYELHCALQLQKAGWKTKSTPRTGDQGADVIAERAGISLVAQCKLYSGSVGNGAVQEVASARQYYRADLAIVVSNAPFTRSARQLAGVLNIKLLYHDELRSFVG